MVDERSGYRGLLRPPEIGAVGPDAVQNDRQLACDGDFGLFGTNALYQPTSHAFSGDQRLTLVSSTPAASLRQVRTKPSPHFGNSAYPIDFAGLVAPRRQAKIGTHVPRMIETLRVVDRGHISQRHNRAGAGYRHAPFRRSWPVVRWLEQSQRSASARSCAPSPWRRQHNRCLGVPRPIASLAARSGDGHTCR